VLKTIVVGYDGTRTAERALERAAELAQAFDARVIVTDVATPEPPAPTPGAFGITPYYVGTRENEVRRDQELWQQHRKRIDAFLGRPGVEYEFAGVVGSPATEIVAVAEQRRADLIVVGTREPGLLERLLEGDVSRGVAGQARCDVLIVHPPHDANSPPAR
jgi:nucleotide-binding universal stress UspA family protein